MNRGEGRTDLAGNHLLLIFGMVICVPVFLWLLVLVIYFGNSKQEPGTNANSSFVSSLDVAETLSVIQEIPGGEPALWVGAVDSPYAIVRIKKITHDTIVLTQNSCQCGFVRIQVNMVSSFHIQDTDRQALGLSKDESVTESNCFDLYFSENSISQLEKIETVMVCLVRMNLDGKYYYGPCIDDQGMSEYLSVKNGKLKVDQADFNTLSFTPINVLNESLDDIRGYVERGGKESDFTKSVPNFKIVDGMSIEEVESYFSAWDNAKRAYLSERTLNLETPI